MFINMYKSYENRDNNLKRKKGEMKLGTLNQVELQNLRHFIGSKEISYNKLTNYADSAVDPQIKQILNKAAQDTLNSKQKLLSFFN